MDAVGEALRDLKVIDLTSMIAGPTLTRLFGELGADVIHVEPPQGDDGRNSTSPYMGREGIIYQTANRNKRGIVVDLKRPAGRDLVRRMVGDADMFVQNMTPGTIDRLGLGYSDLHKLNPRLVYVSITGWGPEGPLANEPGYDVIIQAFSGSMRRYDETGPPRFNGSMVGDPSAPALAAFAAMVALRKRDETGEGSHVTTSLLQGALHMMTTRALVAEDDTGEPHVRRLPGGAGPFETADGSWVVVCAWNDAQFKRLSQLAGYPHLADDPAYATRPDRELAAIELNELFSVWVVAQTREPLLDTLREHGIPCAPVYEGVDDLMSDEHVRANNFVVGVEHPTKGRLWQLGTAYEIDGQRPQPKYAPMMGEHTDEILREHGWTDDEIAALRADGTVA